MPFAIPNSRAHIALECPACGGQDAEVWPIRKRTPGTRENGWKSSTATTYAVRCWTCDSLGPEKSTKDDASKVGWGNAINRDTIAQGALQKAQFQYYHATEAVAQGQAMGTFSFDKGLGLVTWTRKKQ